LNKKARQEKIVEIIRAKQVTNQMQLLAELESLGISANQATASRDLTEIGVIKIHGVYQLPHLDRGGSPLVDVLDVQSAGDNLIVIKTAAGEAQIVGITIDRAKIAEVVGTVAGDDTIFVAVNSREDQGKAIKQIYQLFTSTSGD
jgi:transcriptional regulator of arginine metabolism